MKLEVPDLEFLEERNGHVKLFGKEQCKNVRSGSNIVEFFTGRSIFITGGTGFIGKVLVEKLLRSCPDIETIYLLMRPKHHLKLEDRLHELKQQPIFCRLREEGLPGIFDKLKSIKGDITKERLGLNESDTRTLLTEVSVVFHCAATVRFNESLRQAVLLNTRGTREITRLALRMQLLEAFVHVSTAFSNPDRFMVDEVVYPAHGDYRHVIECVEKLDDKNLENISPSLLRGLPNTYVYSKSLAEHVVYDQKGLLPAAIFRPSLVCPAYNEPIPGWVDTKNGPMGVLIGASTGVLRSVKGDGNMKTDLLPVDFAINAMIAVAWHTAKTKRLDIPVYNCTTSSELGVTWNQLLEVGLQEYHECPSLHVFWYPGGGMHCSKLVYLFCFVFLQFIPALLLDSYLLLSCRKPSFLKLQKRMFTSLSAIEYFLSNEWTFKNSNLRSLLSYMTNDDKRDFNFDASEIEIQEYVKRWVLGLRRFVVKLDDSNIPEARTKLQRLFWIDQLFRIVFYGCIVLIIAAFLQKSIILGQRGLQYIHII